MEKKATAGPETAGAEGSSSLWGQEVPGGKNLARKKRGRGGVHGLSTK